jgi:hypothetical protein
MCTEILHTFHKDKKLDFLEQFEIIKAKKNNAIAVLVILIAWVMFVCDLLQILCPLTLPWIANLQLTNTRTQLSFSSPLLPAECI